jgi:hypothetical protein
MIELKMIYVNTFSVFVKTSPYNYLYVVKLRLVVNGDFVRL